MEPVQKNIAAHDTQQFAAVVVNSPCYRDDRIPSLLVDIGIGEYDLTLVLDSLPVPVPGAGVVVLGFLPSAGVCVRQPARGLQAEINHLESMRLADLPKSLQEVLDAPLLVDAFLRPVLPHNLGTGVEDGDGGVEAFVDGLGGRPDGIHPRGVHQVHDGRSASDVGDGRHGHDHEQDEEQHQVKLLANRHFETTLSIYLA